MLTVDILTEKEKQLVKDAREFPYQERDSMVAGLLAVIDRLCFSIKDIEKEKDNIVQNSIRLLGGLTCEKHSEDIRKMSFGEFSAALDQKGCDWCNQTLIEAFGIIIEQWERQSEKDSLISIWGSDIRSLKNKIDQIQKRKAVDPKVL